MSRSKLAEFFDYFIYWYKKLTAPKLEQKSIEFHIKTIHISEKINELSAKGKEQDGLIFRFKSTQDIKNFIQNTLNLSANHAKWAWFVKGLCVAYKEYTYDKYIKKKNNISMYKYFRTLIYHLWFWKGQVEPDKCIRYVTKYVN